MEGQEPSAYDRRYAGEGTYWGMTPSALCDRVLELAQPRLDARPSLIDLGCGEGRNAIYFAQRGFRVTGVDLSLPGLEKLERFATESGAEVRAIRADVRGYWLADTYDVVFSTGLVHYLPPETRRERFEHFKARTAPNGLNVHSALVDKPFLEAAPDAEAHVVLFTSGELMSYYWDWEIVYCVEEVFDCLSGGAPHKHAVNRVIARRYAGSGRKELG